MVSPNSRLETKKEEGQGYTIWWGLWALGFTDWKFGMRGEGLGVRDEKAGIRK